MMLLAALLCGYIQSGAEVDYEFPATAATAAAIAIVKECWLREGFSFVPRVSEAEVSLTN